MAYSHKLEHSKGLDKPDLHPLSIWQLWRHRYRSRKQLHALLLGDAARLHQDLGLSTEAAMKEINKPFWQC